MFILEKYQIFSNQNEINKINRFFRSIIISRLILRKTPIRSLIFLFYFYFEFIFFDFYTSYLNHFNNILLKNNFYDYLDEESDFILYNYVFKNGSIMKQYDF